MKDDQRIALTKRLLREGLLCLLSKTDLNKISVTQLCIESGVNRATFYRHYEEPRDILNDIKYEIFQEVATYAEKAASRVTRGNGWNLHAATFTSILIY